MKRKKQSAVIRWRAVPGATGYQVRIGKATKKVPAAKITVKKLQPGKKYTVKVAAVNAAGSSPTVTVKVKKYRKQ